jgi:hypothetical protein
MTLKEFFDKIEARHHKKIDWEYDGMSYLRTTVFNTHTLGLDNEMKQARLDLLFAIDNLYGTSIDNRQY